MTFLKIIFMFFWDLTKSHSKKTIEIAILRQQLANYKISKKKPKINNIDRIFWSVLSKVCTGWESLLVIVEPETVVRWQRKAFKLFWKWKSKPKGRPKKDRTVRELIKEMSKNNLTWGTPRIQCELELLGYKVTRSTILKYMYKKPKPPSQTWKTFLKNHASEILCCDFFTVPTICFRNLVNDTPKFSTFS